VPLRRPAGIEAEQHERGDGAEMKLLVIEDDPVASDYLCTALKESGHVVDDVDDGMKGLQRATSETYDVLIVDRMLPSLDGLTVIETLRKTGVDTPVLIVSALGEVDERVRGLRSGGDDYLVKPYAFSELLARVEVLANRRGAGAQPTRLQVADLELDLLARRAARAGQQIELQQREFQLLEFLMRHAGQVVTRTMLLEGVWDFHFDPQTNVIDVHISRLRQKVDKGFDRPLIHTLRGAGYSIRES
jgi:two-component system OmpR family response regulator